MLVRKKKKFVVNATAEVDLEERTQEYVTMTVNLGGTGKVRKETLDGIDYLVVPMIIMAEGVLNGSGGPLLYRANEMKESAEWWNAKPVVVNHPMVDNSPVSACTPDMLAAHGTGIMLNTTFKPKSGRNKPRLYSEAWIREDKLETLDPTVLEKIQNNIMQEVSTGLYTNVIKEEGTFNGKKYNGIATNFRPDHLAILPNQKGACSIEDGAGLLRVNKLVEDGETSNLPYLFAAQELVAAADRLMAMKINAMSFSDIRSAICMALEAKYSTQETRWAGYIEDIFTGFFIYYVSGKLFKQSYSISNEAVSLVGDPAEVRRVIEYRNADGSYVGNAAHGPSEEKKDMAIQKDRVDKLIGNGDGQFSEADREVLTNMDEKHFSLVEKMHGMKKKPAESAKTEIEKVTNKESEDAVRKAAAEAEALIKTNNAPKKPKTLQEELAEMSPETRGLVSNLLAEREAEVEALRQELAANEHCKFTLEGLKGFDKPALLALRESIASATPPTTPATPAPDPRFKANFAAQASHTVRQQPAPKAPEGLKINTSLGFLDEEDKPAA